MACYLIIISSTIPKHPIDCLDEEAVLVVVVRRPHTAIQLVSHVKQKSNTVQHLLLVLVASD